MVRLEAVPVKKIVYVIAINSKILAIRLIKYVDRAVIQTITFNCLKENGLIYPEC